MWLGWGCVNSRAWVAAHQPLRRHLNQGKTTKSERARVASPCPPSIYYHPVSGCSACRLRLTRRLPTAHETVPISFCCPHAFSPVEDFSSACAIRIIVSCLLAPLPLLTHTPRIGLRCLACSAKTPALNVWFVLTGAALPPRKMPR